MLLVSGVLRTPWVILLAVLPPAPLGVLLYLAVMFTFLTAVGVFNRPSPRPGCSPSRTATWRG